MEDYPFVIEERERNDPRGGHVVEGQFTGEPEPRPMNSWECLECQTRHDKDRFE